MKRRKAAMTYEVQMSDEEWRNKLEPERYEVLRGAATEPPFSGSLLHVDADGRFACAGCGQVLFDTQAKFDSGSGWPSFDSAIPGTVEEHDDSSHFMRRTEIRCSRCGGHLGHVFDDGPTDTGRRFCVNSLAIEFEEGGA
jgi:peptide-methionine (R)-S-oxide reductase